MSETAVAGRRTAWRGRLGTEVQPARRVPDARRALRLVLAAMWLLDAVLQCQSFMYSKAFTQMIGGTAAGNPAVIALPIAVLLWPAGRDGGPAPFTAARAVGARLARALWLVLWLSLAYFVLLSANRAPRALSSMIAGMESGEPGSRPEPSQRWPSHLSQTNPSGYRKSSTNGGTSRFAAGVQVGLRVRPPTHVRRGFSLLAGGHGRADAIREGQA